MIHMIHLFVDNDQDDLDMFIGNDLHDPFVCR